MWVVEGVSDTNFYVLKMTIGLLNVFKPSKSLKTPADGFVTTHTTNFKSVAPFIMGCGKIKLLLEW